MKTRILSLLLVGLLAGMTPAKAGFLSYSVFVTNPFTPSTFGVSFSTPIAPILGLSDYSFSSSITLTDGGIDGVSASVGSLPEFWQLSIGDSSATFTVLDDIGGSASLVGVGPHNFSASGAFDCSALSGGCAWLKLDFSFGLSGEGDQLNSSGTFDLSPQQSVPEPATLALFGLGLLGLGFARRGKK